MRRAYWKLLAVDSVLGQLEAEVANHHASVEARFSAANAIKSLLRDNGHEHRTRRLIDVCLSYLLNDVLVEVGRNEAPVEVGIWRHFRIDEVCGETDVKRISTPELRTVCRLFFEADRHQESRELFRLLVEREPTGPNLIQAAYNLENVARRAKDPDLVDEAIQMIEHHRSVTLADPVFVAEVQHILGHLYILKGRLSVDHTLAWEAQGVRLLESSHLEDPSYTSCFVFSYAEYGDYLTAIDRGLAVLRERPYSSLPDRDAEIVDLEITFYLAYSLMAIGEFEQSKALLRIFMNATARKGLLEARDHARLFSMKLELKRRGLNQFDNTSYAAFADLISSLRFSSAESSQIRDENNRYKQILKFLEISDTKARIDRSALERMAENARSLIDSLVTFSPSLLTEVSIQIGPPNATGVDSLESKIRKAIPEAWSVKAYFIDPSNVRYEELSRDSALVLLWCSRDRPPPISVPYPVIQVGVRGSESAGVISFDSAVHLCIVALARICVQRYLYEDQYVYGIVPCTVSPATKFQHPSISISEIIA